MDTLKKWKGALTRTRSGGRQQSRQPDPNNLHVTTRCHRMAPQGCFSVYVGPERRRFVVGIKNASHPLFRMLLEDAELEYGYASEGPLLLPCDVELFCKVLAEMDSDDTDLIYPSGCAMSLGSYSPLSPSKLLRLNQF